MRPWDSMPRPTRRRRGLPRSHGPAEEQWTPQRLTFGDRPARRRWLATSPRRPVADRRPRRACLRRPPGHPPRPTARHRRRSSQPRRRTACPPPTARLRWCATRYRRFLARSRRRTARPRQRSARRRRRRVCWRRRLAPARAARSRPPSKAPGAGPTASSPPVPLGPASGRELAYWLTMSKAIRSVGATSCWNRPVSLPSSIALLIVSTTLPGASALPTKAWFMAWS